MNKTKKFLPIIVVIITLMLIYSVIYFATLITELPSDEEIKNFSPVLSTKIFDRNNELITELFTEKRTWIEFNAIPEHVKLAVLAIEDHTFYRHWGIN
ncbi:MAG: transglycosylase domain-containing protein, partial [Endomicrobia bacterium]|nr:transglycosylase domain-containing protein [Endomicrobiia bacterium]